MSQRLTKYLYVRFSYVGLILLFLSQLAFSVDKVKSDDGALVYVGTFNRGIYAFRINPDARHFDSLGMVADVERPTWVIVHPNHRLLYAVSELGNDGKGEGYISSYKIDLHTGRLSLLNKVSGGGGGTTHLALDKTAKILVAANFAGQVATFHLNADGTIGERTARIQHVSPVPDPPFPNRPHPHGVTIAPDNRYVFVPDTGLNKVFIYKLNSKNGELASGNSPVLQLPDGYGPRRIAFRPDGRFAYLIEENNSSVTALAYEKAGGELRPLQTISTLPENFKGEKSAAELWIDKRGQFLYAASRSDDTIVAFSIDPMNGTLSHIQSIPTQGKSPRHVTADPAGQYLFVANWMSDNVTIFKIDSSNGQLVPTGQELAVPAPTCVQLVAAE